MYIKKILIFLVFTLGIITLILTYLGMNGYGNVGYDGYSRVYKYKTRNTIIYSQNNIRQGSIDGPSVRGGGPRSGK
ncbi:MAG: hypothetical protein VXX85_05705 [Candidatus Margulisiibacteriota bacterium]|nr:hypothetical protein [Candidatus Margulisiibacteriota bacterium]